MKWMLYTITACALFFTACAKQPPADTTRLKKDVVIGGRNVSAMTVAEARAALNADADERLSAQTLTLLLPNGRTAFSADALGAKLDVESALTEAAALRARGGNRRIDMQLTIDDTKLAAALNAFADQSERPARDAAFTVDASLATPVVYSAEQTGVRIDRAALETSVREALLSGSSARLTVPCETVAPNVTLAAIQKQNALVAQYATSFSGRSHSAENRVYNMEKAAAAINGLVLQPGFVFDCNAVLGDRNEQNGWRLAPGIRNGRYEEEYGGGVCQISSTLFNAVMMADLTILERSPHSWPMGYVEIGRDATISTGGKNFRFENSSAAPLTLYMHVDRETQTVTASIYGKPLANGRYVDVVSENTGTLETAGEIVMLDESLPAGTRQVEREARDGKTSVTYKEYRAADGTLIDRTVAYEDTYRAIDGITYVSTDLYYAAEPEPDAENAGEQQEQPDAQQPGQEAEPEREQEQEPAPEESPGDAVPGDSTDIPA